MENTQRNADSEFQPWWDAPVIGTHEHQLSRKDAVLTLANKRGGAHVAKNMGQRYAYLRSVGTGWEVRNETGAIVDIGDPVLATVRQISYETEKTVREQLSELLT